MQHSGFTKEEEKKEEEKPANSELYLQVFFFLIKRPEKHPQIFKGCKKSR